MPNEAQDTVQQHYEQVAESYREAFFYENASDYQHWLVQQVIEALDLQPSRWLCSIGCGNGDFAAALAATAKLKNPVWAVDPSKEMLEGTKRHSALLSVVADGVGFAHQSYVYDCCLLKEVVHHLPHADLIPLYSGIQRQLVRDGRVLTVTRPQEVDYPFFHAALQSWKKVQAPWQLYVEAQEHVGLTVEVQHRVYPVRLRKQQWLEMLANRFWSHLSEFTDEELASGVQEVAKKFRDQDVLEFEDRLVFLVGSLTEVNRRIFTVQENRMNFALIQGMEPSQRNWLAQAFVGMIVADGKVEDRELPFLRQALEWPTDKALVEDLMRVVRLEKKMRLPTQIEMDAKDSFEVLKMLAGVMISDGRLSPSEIHFFYKVGQTLRMPENTLETLWKTARKELEDQCPKAIVRIGQEKKVVALQNVTRERVTFRYHRPVVKGAHGSLNIQRYTESGDPELEGDWYASLHGQVLSTNVHARDEESFVLRFEFTQSIREDHGLMQLLGVPFG